MSRTLLFAFFAALPFFGCDASGSSSDQPAPSTRDSSRAGARAPTVYSVGEHQAVVEGVASRGQATEEVAQAHPPVALLDLNQSGRADLVAGRSDRNVAYVFFDIEDISERRYDASRADLVIRGLCPSNRCAALGEPFARGDVNGDGFDDLVVGDRTGPDGDGRAYVIYATDGLPSGEAEISEVADVEVSFEGLSAKPDHFGETLAAADLNGDGFDDLLIGAPVARTAGNGPGSVSVIYGRSDLPARISAPSEAGLVLHGRSEYDHLGLYLATGDWDGDGYEDAALSSFDDFSRSGRTWILYGRPKQYEGSAQVGDGGEPTLSEIAAAERGAEMVHLASGDANGDGQSDLILGAGRAEAVHLIHGPVPAGSAFDAGGAPRQVTLAPPERDADGGVFASSSFGRALFAYDADSDGSDELLVGAKGYTPPRPSPQDVRNVGGAFLFDLEGAKEDAGFSDLLTYRFEGNNDGTTDTLPNVEFGRAVTMFRLGGESYVAVLDEVRDSSIYLFKAPTTSSLAP